MLACRADISLRRLMTCAYLAGLCFWFGNLYWLVIVTTPGYIAFSFVQACYWPLLALSVRFVLEKRWPLFLAAPIIFVGAEAIQGVLFTGFSWYYLAHSQYQHLPLIQICDIFGTLGVSVLIAMENGWVVDSVTALKEKKLFRHIHLAGLVITSLLLVLTWNYGNQRLLETRKYQTEGPLLGSVQPNVPAYVKEEMDNAQEILDDLIADSDKCFDAGAAMVCWPETMVLAAMNPEYIYGNYQQSYEAKAFKEKILNFCKDRGFILFGATSAGVGQQWNQYNSAFLYRPDGAPAPKIYHKIHLVPFGEFIPFKNIGWLYRIFMFFNPYDYDYSLTAGTQYTRFEMKANDQKYDFGVLICYEDTDPTIARKLVLDKKGAKKADFLVNISNDGWYVHFKDRQVIPMVELAQRAAISTFRCVENLIRIIRSVNTGISCLIEPTGKIRDNFTAGNLPKEAMKRQGVAGWFVDTIPIDDRVTFFSKHGRWLDITLGTSWSLILLLSIYRQWKNKLRRKL